MAKKLVLILIAIAALSSMLFADDLTEFLRQAEANIDLEEMQGLLEGQAESQLGAKCPRGGCLTNASIENENPSLMVFVSFSVPEASWKEHSQALEKLNGAFILRGLPDNSFSEFAKKVKHLRELGINAPILLDADAYAKYRIHHVPSIVLKNGQIHDKLTGNLQLPEALTIFARHGQTASFAKQLQDELQGDKDAPRQGGATP